MKIHNMSLITQAGIIWMLGKHLKHSDGLKLLLALTSLFGFFLLT